MSSRKRRTLQPKFKARVALEALKSDKTLSELSSIHKVHPNQITQWKKKLTSEASDLFTGKNPHHSSDDEGLIQSLYEEIGRLKMDIKWLEKKL